MSMRGRQMAMMLAPGIIAFLVALLSVADMFIPRPYDGVVLETDRPGSRRVRAVVPTSGAEQAGIRPGDLIVGIDRDILTTTTHAQELLNRHRIGERVPYLIRSGGQVREVAVELGRRSIGDTSYLYACFLGFLFFLVGTFVVVRQPRLPATRAFSIMCSLFMLFLVCRLRPASYSWVDSFVLTTGTVALLFLPGAFLHFFLIFPRPIWQWRRDPIADTLGWIAKHSSQLLPVYLVPPLVYAGVVLLARQGGGSLALISGAPAANWWVMVFYMALGMGALYLSSRHLPEVHHRRGAGLVFLGTMFGVVPFLVLAVAFPSFLHTERFIFTGVVPLIFVPLTFAYAIVRFQLMDIRVILRKSLLYTVSTALVTAMYALGIASFNWVFRGTELADSPYFPVVFALAIVLLFEPLRHRIQGPVDRFFFAERLRLQRAMVEMGEAFTEERDLRPVVRQLVERLPELLGLHFSALYLIRGGSLQRTAGPDSLPESIEDLPMVADHLQRRGSMMRLDDFAPLRLISHEADHFCSQMSGAGAEVVGLLATPRRTIGMVVLSGKTGQISLEREELDLVRGLLHQASIALETTILLDERARQAELERELKIAASIQAALLPGELMAADGWEVAAICQPAREVGGDFYTQLPGRQVGERSVAYGDVSGKSISAALMMMAAHEVLHSLALTHPDPEDLLHLSNERLYGLRNRGGDLHGGSFVALGFLTFLPNGGKVRYSLAGQPPPLVKRCADVEALCMPDHRLPLGALRQGGYEMLEVELEPGDLLLAYSDGVVDAQSPEGEFFGEERLVDLLNNGASSPQDAIEGVLQGLKDFTHGKAPYDDLTLVAAQWTGAER
ncbi:MAG: SpoIIE family protein phosphatase [bacterium]|nr:SpoIIE family protein phosphatase [bacterium]